MAVNPPREFLDESIEVSNGQGDAFRFRLLEDGGIELSALLQGEAKATLTFRPETRSIANRLAYAFRRCWRRMDENAAKLPSSHQA